MCPDQVADGEIGVGNIGVGLHARRLAGEVLDQPHARSLVHAGFLEVGQYLDEEERREVST